MTPQSHRNLAGYILLAVFAFAVYTPGMWWGAPHATTADRTHAWGVDDETPLGPLAEIHNIIAPKPDRNYGYPLMYSFIVTAAYTPYLAYLRLSGQWSEISSEYPFGMDDPVTVLKVMTCIAHFVTVLMGIGVVLAAYATGRTLGNSGTGLFAALFAMTSYPMYYYARTGNVDIPMLFFVALTLLAFTRCMADGFTVARAMWLGAFAGLALATKEMAIGIFLAIPFFLLALSWREHAGRWTTWPFWRAPLAGLGVSFLALCIGSGLFVEPSRYFRHIEEILSHTESIKAGEIFVPYVFPFSIEGNSNYLQRVLELLAEMLSWPGLLLAGAGLILVPVIRSRTYGLATLLLVYLVFMIFTVRSPQMRYFMPAAYLLAFPAALLISHALESRQVLLRSGVLLTATGIIAFNLLRGAGLTWEMIHDSRYDAAEWLAEHTEVGDSIEYFGPNENLPPLQAGVQTRIATFYGGIYAAHETDDARAGEILQDWSERRPKYIILTPDLTSQPGSLYSRTCPPRLCDGLLDGSSGFVLAASFKTTPLFHWLQLPSLDYPTVNPPIHIFTLPEQPAA